MGRHLADEGPPKRRNAHLIPGTPTKPSGLSDRAGFYWDQIIGQLIASGVQLTVGDSHLITLAACTKADLELAWQDLKTEGRYVTSTTGVRKVNPSADDTMRLTAQLSKLLWQLNLSPRSRGNPPTTPAKSDGDLDDIFKGSPEIASDGTEIEIIEDGDR